MAEFDVQSELHDMRRERKEDHVALTSTVTEGFAKGSAWMHSHELSDERRFTTVNSSISQLQTIQKTAKWFVRSALVAMLMMIADIIGNHVGPFLVKLMAKGH